MLPLINIYYLIFHDYIDFFTTYWPFLRIDLMLWNLALLALLLHQKITPIQQKAVNKIHAKLKITQQESST
jgi:hypothetical protein